MFSVMLHHSFYLNFWQNLFNYKVVRNFLKNIPYKSTKFVYLKITVTIFGVALATFWNMSKMCKIGKFWTQSFYNISKTIKYLVGFKNISESWNCNVAMRKRFLKSRNSNPSGSPFVLNAFFPKLYFWSSWTRFLEN